MFYVFFPENTLPLSGRFRQRHEYPDTRHDVTFYTYRKVKSQNIAHRNSPTKTCT